MPHLYAVERGARLLTVLTLCSACLLSSSATAEVCRGVSSLREVLEQPEAKAALHRLRHSPVRPGLLRSVLRSQSAAPFLRDALPKIADLAGVPGIEELLHRFSSNGLGGAYELAVAHAHRRHLRSVSGLRAGNQLDAELLSGTVIEAKSAEPARPEHVLEQIRRRGSDGARVLLALGYRPGRAYLGRLRALSQEMGGRLEVQLIPIAGDGYQVLVPGRAVEDPTDRVQKVILAPPRMRHTPGPPFPRPLLPRAQLQRSHR